MTVRYDRDFLKMLKKQDVRIRHRFRRQLALFIGYPNDPLLNNHILRDEWAGHRSIDVTNDHRAIFIVKNEGGEKLAYFIAIGTHDQLYA